ncbi:MAG: flavodoxin domain-containing protein [Chloroflexota bacterium]
MRVLVSVASRHGSTAEIADRIGEVLKAAGIDADIRPPDQVASVAHYDGVILGSGVYAGRWLGPAKQLAERESADLKARPVWLFSSGPVGDPAKPAADPVDVDLVRKWTDAIDHRVFPGKLDRQELGFGERAIVLAVHAAEGDFRPWEDVTAWAAGIARTVQASRVEEPVR